MTLSDIEKEFEKKASIDYDNKDADWLIMGCYECGEAINRTNIKSFLSQALEQALEACEPKRKDTFVKGLANRIAASGYNQALADYQSAKKKFLEI